MQSIQRLVLHNPMALAWPAATFAITFVIVWVVRRLLLRALRAWTEGRKSHAGLILADALHGPTTMIWALIAAAHFAIQASDLPPRVAEYEPKALMALWIVSFTILCTALAGNLVRYYGAQVPNALPVTTLSETLAQLAVVVLGLVLLLSALDFRITPILTALGVGGLAVALALQDTLSNLFSGFYVAVARQVRIGDYIKLNTGEEGYVTDIGWRSTTIRALANNFILVPNAKLAQAVVTNYYLPEKRMGASVQVLVGHGSDPERVEAALLEVAQRGVNEIAGMLAEPAPNVMFEPGFCESGLGLTVNYQVSDFAAQFGVRNELRKRIFRRLREEGIEMAMPSRAVYLRGAAPPDGDAG